MNATHLGASDIWPKTKIITKPLKTYTIHNTLPLGEPLASSRLTTTRVCSGDMSMEISGMCNSNLVWSILQLQCLHKLRAWRGLWNDAADNNLSTRMEEGTGANSFHLQNNVQLEYFRIKSSWNCIQLMPDWFLFFKSKIEVFIYYVLWATQLTRLPCLVVYVKSNLCIELKCHSINL